MTNNVNRRLREHNGGYVKPTKSRRPLKVVHVERCESRIEARKREKFFKTGTGREFRGKILKDIPW